MTLCLTVEREDQKKIHIENFSEYMQLTGLSGSDKDGVVLPLKRELTQDEKDLELLQK
jgi:adenylylsulfate kinase-like enzyme